MAQTYARLIQVTVYLVNERKHMYIGFIGIHIPVNDIYLYPVTVS